MKSVSGIMYTIGKVFNIIGFFLNAIFIALGIIIKAYAKEIFERRTAGATYTEADIKIVGTTLMVFGIIAFVVSFVVFILATIAKSKLKNEKRDIVPHVIMIIIGVFGDIFYLLGGVFGVIAEADQEENRAS